MCIAIKGWFMLMTHVSVINFKTLHGIFQLYYLSICHTMNYIFRAISFLGWGRMKGKQWNQPIFVHLWDVSFTGILELAKDLVLKSTDGEDYQFYRLTLAINKIFSSNTKWIRSDPGPSVKLWYLHCSLYQTLIWWITTRDGEKNQYSIFHHYFTYKLSCIHSAKTIFKACHQNAYINTYLNICIYTFLIKYL